MKNLNDYISERLNPRNLGPVDSDTLPKELKERYKLIYNPKTSRYDCNYNITVKEDLIDGTGHLICNFGVVKGNFDCNRSKILISLKGSPKKIEGWFDCSECDKLESLKGAPKEVGWSFYCSGCPKLETLEGAPEKVAKDFICIGCENLKSLEGAPEEVSGDFDCSGCPKLKDYDINTKIGGELIK